MSTVTLPRADLAAVDADGKPSRDLYRWMRDVTARIGGVSGSSTNDLAESAFEDAGVAENLAAMQTGFDAVGQVPAEAYLVLYIDYQRLSAEVEELRGVVNEIYKALQGAQQGVILQ